MRLALTAASTFHSFSRADDNALPQPAFILGVVV
jgi:hypothetical protein